jgi:hypothetical protein
MSEFISYEQEQALYHKHVSQLNQYFSSLDLSMDGMPCLLGQQHVLKRRIGAYYGKLSALSCDLTAATR